MSADVVFWALGGLALVGALTVLFTTDVMRLALGLGAFLAALAGLFAWLGFGLLALAQIFLYVGGVLVLVLFAIMLVHRSEPGRPTLTSRHDLLAGVGSAGVAGMLVMLLRPALQTPSAAGSSPDAVAALLLGDLLVPFELAGLLLLAALVAVVAVTGGERE